MSSNNTMSHILSSLGILVNFSVARYMEKEVISNYEQTIKKNNVGKKPKELRKLLSEFLYKDTEEYLAFNSIPGSITSKSTVKKEELDKAYLELTLATQILVNKFNEQNLNKHQMCFILNAIINMMNITESDFREFVKQFQKYKNDETDE